MVRIEVCTNRPATATTGPSIAIHGVSGTRAVAGGGSGPIDFWSSHPGQSSAAERELIGRFQDRFPTLSVKLIDAGKDYDEVAQKFNAALIGTDVPDVVFARRPMVVPFRPQRCSHCP